MASIEIEIVDSAEIKLLFKKLNGFLLDTAPILDEAAAILLNRIRRNYLQETAPDGTKWTPSQAALGRAASGRGGGTLYNTGNLFRSIQLFSVSPTERSIATDVSYGPAHQFGLGKHPKRVFLGFSEVDGQIAERLVKKRFEEAIK